MTSYSAPHRLTVDDLDPASVTTDQLIAMIRSHRQGETYPTGEQLLSHLPVVLSALGDHVLSGKATAFEVAYRLASLIDALEGSAIQSKRNRCAH